MATRQFSFAILAICIAGFAPISEQQFLDSGNFHFNRNSNREVFDSKVRASDAEVASSSYSPSASTEVTSASVAITASTASTAAVSASTVTTSLAPIAELVVLVVQSNLSNSEIEIELESQFEDLFSSYCTGSSNSDCNTYLPSSETRRKRSTCSYDVTIYDSVDQSNQCADCKALLSGVVYACGSSVLPLPANLLAPFFVATSGNFSELTIVSAAAASSYVSTTSTATPATTIVIKYDEGYFIATIVLSVVLGITLLVLVVFIIFYCKMVAKTKRTRPQDMAVLHHGGNRGVHEGKKAETATGSTYSGGVVNNTYDDYATAL